MCLSVAMATEIKEANKRVYIYAYALNRFKSLIFSNQGFDSAKLCSWSKNRMWNVFPATFIFSKCNFILKVEHKCWCTFFVWAFVKEIFFCFATSPFKSVTLKQLNSFKRNNTLCVNVSQLRCVFALCMHVDCSLDCSFCKKEPQSYRSSSIRHPLFHSSLLLPLFLLTPQRSLSGIWHQEVNIIVDVVCVCVCACVTLSACVVHSCVCVSVCGGLQYWRIKGGFVSESGGELKGDSS